MTSDPQIVHAGSLDKAHAFSAPLLNALLEVTCWRDKLHAYVRATHLAVALCDAQGQLIGDCLNPQPTWQRLQAAAAAVAPTAQTGDERHVQCPFALLPRKPCTCIADALAQGHAVFAYDRTRLVHFAVPLLLGGQRVGVILAGQVFDQYPEPAVLEQVARQLGLPPVEIWQQARLEYLVREDTLHVYADLLANLSQMLLQTRYDALREAERLAEMTGLRNQAERARRDAVRAEKALQRVNGRLEKRVAQRTADLQQAHTALHQEVSERHRMQAALFQQEKLAALGTLLANVAHELNNPLAVVALELDNLQEKAGSGAWAKDLEMITQAVERCKSVVQSFLSLARQQPPTRHAVAFNAVIGDVLVLLEHALEADGIGVELQLADELPPLWADANQLHHVVANLITNAHQALRETEAPRQLRLTTIPHADRTQVRLEVEDSGPGIPQGLQQRVFEPFFTTKPEGMGSGLGLPLCRNIVESHGGTIEMVSESGRGTSVSVTLPVAPSDVGSPEAALAPEAPEEPKAARRGRVLLIDDELSVQRALRRLLTRHGHAIHTAANGMEGLAALEAGSYEVILCDIRMPHLDGPGFYRELEQRYPHLRSRIVFLTGDVLSPEAAAFFDQVGCPRLIKPFRAHEVRQMIQQVLNGGHNPHGGQNDHERVG